METSIISKISSHEFVERIVLRKQDALVKVTPAGSGAGQLLGYVIQDLAEQHTKINFFSVDYDAESPLVAAYRVEAVPTLLFFKKGTLVDKLSGLTRKSVISEKIDQFIKQ